ncbi:hypothetical protein LY90DRAFT_641698 [Neocallimastix californiae]|uniref:Scaffoldin n=1 Tax=Neocallimastix californiae TaxID=1754190 RepID=A0A1Y1YPZ8_9FUNG|nr:hypothetical protein LY90DRAFT_641698 [Neocallimastix californiae]|eukprot:ORX99826.1 hypothetical protein LY90DRAFT_641698 [Neocallimastix californiae]
MLGWKYFCLLYILLLYQLQYVLADLEACSNIDITNCPDANDNSTINDYINTNCLKDNFIYRIKDGNCVSKLISGVHIFDAKKEVNIKSDSQITDTYAENYVMYACSEKGCKKTTGYVKIDVLYEKLVEQINNWYSECTNYFMITLDTYNNIKMDDIKKKNLTECTGVFNDGYKKNTEGAYYFISLNGAIKINVNNKVDCGIDKEGTLSSSNTVCLGVDSTATRIVEIKFTDTDEFYLTKSSKSLFTFESGAIILKPTENVIYHDNSPSDETTIIIDTDTKKKAIPLNNSELNNSDFNKYYIYECEGGYLILNCDNNSCKRTFGYFKTNGNNYYSIPYTGFENNKRYLLIDNCGSNIGGLMTGEKFCQGFNEIDDSMTDGQSYIISANSQTIFSNIIEGKSLVISATSNTLIYNGLSANEGIQLFGSGVLISSSETKIDSKDEKNCEYNYYKVESNESERINFDDNDYEYKECTKETAGNLISDKKLCLGNESVDFISQDDKTEYYIYNKGGQYLFVRGVNNMFTIEEFNGSVELKKFNVINTEDVTRIDIESKNANDITDIITNLTLFNCDTEKGICRQTYGYIKSKDNTYYSFDANKSNPNKVVEFTSSKCNDSSDIGTLQTEGKLCIINNSNISVTMTNNNKYAEYVVSVNDSNIFTNDPKSIVIRAISSAFYYDNLYDVSNGKNVVLTDVNTKITEFTEITDINELKAYLCSTFGICTPVNGFVKKDNKYYKISNSGTSEIDSEGLKESCSSNINSLLKGGKFCITGSDNDAINFINNDTISYYMTYDETYELVIAKSNLFILATTSGGTGGELNLINLNDAAITDLTSGTISSDDLPYLALFSCQTTNKICKRTYGYVKTGNDDSTKYYTIDANGLEKNTEFISNISSCKQTDVGKLDTLGNLCIKDESSMNTYTGSLSPSGSYIMYNNNGSVFSEITDINIYITSTSNAFYHNKFVDVSTDGGVKLFQSNKLIDDISSTSLSTDKLSLYICNSEGICNQADGYANINNNYYTIETVASSTLDSNSITDSCSSTNAIGKLIESSKNLCISSIDNVAFPGDNDVNNYIIYETKQGITSYRLVKTAPGLIAKVNLTDQPVDGLNIYEIGKNISKFGLTTEIETSTLINLFFFNCDLTAQMCVQTYGYLKGGNTVYEINKGTNGVTTIKDKDSCNVGDIANLDQFCLNDSHDTVGFGSSHLYVIEVPSNNLFINTTEKIVINTTEEAFYYDNLYRGNEVILTASNVKILESEIKDGDAENLKVYTCGIKGICKQEGGFVVNGENGTKYYSVSQSDKSSSVNLTNKCENSIGKLITDGKLCINENDNEAVAFLTDSNDKRNYIIKNGNSFQFITAIQNIFLISIIDDLTEGVNIINNKSFVKVDPKEITEEDLDLPNLGLFYCIKIGESDDDLSCKRTYGFIKIDKASKYYSLGWHGNSDASDATTTQCNNQNVGKLDSSGALCLYSDKTGTLGSTNLNSRYIISNVNGSIFADKNKINDNILIYADANSFVYENIVDRYKNGIKYFNKYKLTSNLYIKN